MPSDRHPRGTVCNSGSSRDDAGSTVGRSRHHTPARRIFLIDRHGIDTQPVIGEERVGTIGAPLLLQLIMDALRPATHFQASGHDALAAQTTLDTGIHRLPDGIKTLVKRRTAHHRLFIRSFHLRDRQAGTRCHFKHLFRRGKRKRHIGRRLLVLLATHRIQLGIGDHEAAADE